MTSLALLHKKMSDAKDRLNKAFASVENLAVIHYSCESFYGRRDIASPRITSIAIKLLETRQTQSFSIHLVAERLQVPSEDIERRYDELEKSMLDQYFSYISSHRGMNWLHWRMSDTTFGFYAIEHRYQVLGGNPWIIPDDKKINLAEALYDIYGDKYCGHPRLEAIIKMNQITDRDFLSGGKEAQAFDERRYQDLHRSTLRKVDALHGIGERAASNTLKTNSFAFRSFGMNALVFVEGIQKHWITTSLLLIEVCFGVIKNFISS